MADVLNCQYEIANEIANKKDLYDDVVDYFDEKTKEQIIAKEELYRKTIEKSHSSIVTRQYFVILYIDYLKKNSGSEYKKLTSIGLVSRTIENLITGEVKKQILYK